MFKSLLVIKKILIFGSNFKKTLRNLILCLIIVVIRQTKQIKQINFHKSIAILYLLILLFYFYLILLFNSCLYIFEANIILA